MNTSALWLFKEKGWVITYIFPGKLIENIATRRQSLCPCKDESKDSISSNMKTQFPRIKFDSPKNTECFNYVY